MAMLLARVAVKDRAAFVDVYRLTAAKLFGICVRICGERAAAEDVLQEVYAMIWQRADSYRRARSSPITWLATIARNRAIDWRRVQRPSPPVNAALAEEVADARPSAEAMLLLDEHERRLHQCLDELDGNQQAMIRAAFFGGLTYAELAARQDVPLGTAKSWVRRGLMRLRGCLDDA